jgi:hypothetical protein
VQHHAVELVYLEQAVTADRRVMRLHLLQRPTGEIAGEDDVDDVLRGEAPLWCDRVDECDWPLEWQLVLQADLLQQFPLQRVDEALARVDAPTR